MYITVLKMTRDSILNADNLLNVNSSNTMHKWLTAQQDLHRRDDKLLYKIIMKSDEIFIYIQSKTPFNINNIDKHGLIFVKSFEFNISSEGTYTFDIQTFPCKTINDKRLYLTDIQQRYNWLQKQFKKFNIDLLECTEYSMKKFYLDKDKVKEIPSSSFRGKIYINDINLGNQLLQNGLGRFKNYGLGLILLK